MGKSARSLRASSFCSAVTATDPWYRGPRGRLFGDARLECGLERVPYRLELDAVEDLLVEAAHDQALGLAAGEPPGHAVEELVAIDLAHGCPVRAADVVRFDLQAGDRVGVRVRRKKEVAVLLVGVRLLGVLLDPAHPAPDGGGAVAESSFEGEVGSRVGRDVLLQRVVIE